MENFAAEGGFRVSARCQKGEIEGVRIRSSLKKPERETQVRPLVGLSLDTRTRRNGSPAGGDALLPWS